MTNYLFTSSRLGFRNWDKDDLKKLAALNNDDEVMRYFPKKPTLEETENFIMRMQKSYIEKGFCYFAVEIIHNSEFLGFIGLCEKSFKADFTPFVDIGWRLKKSGWNNGFATEGAKACLDFGLYALSIPKIVAIAPIVNKSSEAVMKKIGMDKVKIFEHPQLLDYDDLKTCVLYESMQNILNKPLMS